MNEQLSIIISILAALLTGGFLMIFIESQKTAGSVTERFHFVMNPFFHSFTNYVKFISSFKTCFTFRVSKDSDYVKSLKDSVEEVARLGGQSIISGQDYPTDYFTAKKLDSICNSINNIWHCLDTKRNYINGQLDFDSHHAQMFSEQTKGYLEAISPKYKGVQLTEDLLANVSGDFFTEIYQPIQYILPHYEFWQRKEKEFKTLALVTVSFTLLTMILILLLSCCIPIWVYNALCVACCGLLMFELYKLIKLENLSKAIMR
ncbi:MAG: hypothetical protein LBQ74_20625 [Prevotella sp.]|jgi:hypothetical protein|nr:hypothetical protein [Prevotella sp.]